jgi:hypothetical protein
MRRLLKEKRVREGLLVAVLFVLLVAFTVWTLWPVPTDSRGGTLTCVESHGEMSGGAISVFCDAWASPSPGG